MVYSFCKYNLGGISKEKHIKVSLLDEAIGTEYDEHNLILDLDRTLDLDNQINQHLFAAGYPMPTQAYRLIKDQ